MRRQPCASHKNKLALNVHHWTLIETPKEKEKKRTYVKKNLHTTPRIIESLLDPNRPKIPKTPNSQIREEHDHPTPSSPSSTVTPPPSPSIGSVITGGPLGFAVLRSGKRDWQHRGRPGAQQYAYPGVNYLETHSMESPGESPAISLPTPPPPPLMASLPPPPPPPPPRRPQRRSVTFAESPPKSPKKSRFSPFIRRPSITMLDVAVPWTPASPRVWSGRPGDYKPEYIT